MIKDSVLINAAIQQGLIENDSLMQIRHIAERERRDLFTTLMFMQRIPLAAFYRSYAELHNIPFISGSQISVEYNLLKRMPKSLVEKRFILPVKSDDSNIVTLAISNPEDHASIEQARRALGKDIVIALANPSELKHIIEKAIYGSATPETAQNINKFDPVTILDEILKEAYLNRASDIHFEPSKESFHVRFRVDGQLQYYPVDFRAEEGQSLMSRMKVLAQMDISEQRMPQDGSFTYFMEHGKEFDIRAATMPTRFGERATLRILGSDTESFTMTNLGLSEENLERFRATIKKPHGMILLTGPTGSGKSTTLYAALREISDVNINILTVEDPIEYVMGDISQVQVSSKVSFASALRGLLRHDPDVIMVGEIRDGETADIAVKAAMTGHMVFSTLHTNSAASAIGRLEDLGVEKFLIGSTLLCVISQRLVRRLCNHCKQPHEATLEEKIKLSVSDETSALIFKAKGCSHCMDTGYRGRIALFELLWIDENIIPLIHHKATEAEITKNASAYHSLAHDGRKKVLSGITSLSEIERLGLHNVTAEIEGVVV